MKKLQGKLRQKAKGGNYYYRLTIANGIRKEFALKTADETEAIHQRQYPKRSERAILIKDTETMIYSEKMSRCGSCINVKQGYKTSGIGYFRFRF